MKKWLILVVLAGLVFVGYKVVFAKGRNLNRGEGWPRYVDIVVTWDGSTDDADNDGNTDSSTWTVWGPKWDPQIGEGTPLADCSDCLDMSTYEFRFVGKTLQFEEIYVPGVAAYPQTHHIVLHDQDGDGIYTGSIDARYDFPGESGEWIRRDVIEYEVSTENGNVTNFYYVEHEYKKQI